MDRRKIGLVLIILGVLAWPIGIFLGVETSYTLAAHLCGVIPGVILRGSKILKKIREKLSS
ncbi:MAG: hypothetical protein ACLFVI_07305 [Archaeoglobaceae archaeon]